MTIYSWEHIAADLVEITSPELVIALSPAELRVERARLMAEWIETLHGEDY
jgi:hypothetical protein